MEIKVISILFFFLSFSFPLQTYLTGESNKILNLEEDYVWKYTKSFTDFSDPADLNNYFTGTAKKKISIVIKKNYVFFNQDTASRNNAYYFLSFQSSKLKNMPLSKVNPVLQSWYKSSPDLFSNWSISIYKTSFQGLKFRDENQGWEVMKAFFDRGVKKGLLSETNGEYSPTTDLVLSFPPERILFTWNLITKWDRRMRLFRHQGNSSYWAYSYPFLSNLTFDIRNLQKGDLEVSSRKEDIEASYLNLWYVNYFSLNNITKSGKLNDHLIRKKISYGKEGKESFYFWSGSEKSFSSFSEFTAFFSTALNYLEVKDYLKENSLQRFSILFSNYLEKKEREVTTLLESQSKYLNLKPLFLHEKEKIRISTTILLHQVIQEEISNFPFRKNKSF